jgi:hypothetical protein
MLACIKQCTAFRRAGRPTWTESFSNVVWVGHRPSRPHGDDWHGGPPFTVVNEVELMKAWGLETTSQRQSIGSKKASLIPFGKDLRVAITSCGYSCCFDGVENLDSVRVGFFIHPRLMTPFAEPSGPRCSGVLVLLNTRWPDLSHFHLSPESSSA